MIRIALIVVLLLGCKIRNELSCENPDNRALSYCIDGPVQESCSATDACSTGVCKLPEGFCVDCLVDTDCSGNTPICGTANNCEACDTHAECPSKACNFATGACLDEGVVAYVSPTGTDTTTCSLTLPCGDLTSAVNTDKPFIKFESGQVDVTTGQTVDHDVTILADPNARLRRITTTGPIVTIPNDSDVAIQDLQIHEGSGATGHAISVTSANANLILDRVKLLDNGGRGLDVSQGAKVTMRRCIVSGNNEGGISLTDVDFDISNSLFVRNDGSTVGGLRIVGQGSASVFRFNTIANNNATDPTQSGVNCDTIFTANNNIVTDNGLDPTCRFDFTLFNGVLPAMGIGNKSGDPQFEETDPAKATEKKYYRIKTGSAAVDQADPNATEATDIDGQARPNPAGTLRDMGADELDP